jgi:hypothetical protein
MKFDSEKEK